MLVYEKAKPLIGNMLNYEVVGGTTPPTTFNKENTIWINTSNALKEHYFCYNQPTDYVTTTTYYVFGGSTASSDYKGGWTNGNASSTSNSQITCGTDGWIRTTSKVDLTNISMLTAYIRINQPYESEIYLAVGDSYGYKYTGSKHTRLDVASGSATSNIYKTITLDVSSLTGSHYICLSHRGFGSSYWQYIKGTMTTDNTPSGTVWIQTDSDNATVGFNALKRNELMVYPTKLKQWNGSAWKSVAGTLYQGSTATLVYNAQTDLIIEGEVQSFAGGFTLLMQQYNSELTYPSGYMLYRNTNSGSVSRVDSTKKIDWSKYNTLKIKLGASDCRYANVWFMIGQNKDIPTWWWPGDDRNYVSFYQLYRNPVWNADTVLELDISNVTNTGIFMMGMTGNVGDLYISDIWIE